MAVLINIRWIFCETIWESSFISIKCVSWRGLHWILIDLIISKWF